MTTTLFESNGIISLGSIGSEQDLELGPSIHINPHLKIGDVIAVSDT